jgi:hypothetical protein
MISQVRHPSLLQGVLILGTGAQGVLGPEQERSRHSSTGQAAEVPRGRARVGAERQDLVPQAGALV